MKTKQRKRTGYIYPASALLEQFDEDTWASTIAEHLGVGRHAVQTWREGKTCLDQWAADRYACAIGKHPSEIWPEWFDQCEQVAS
jgi:hypothetical protein